MADLSLLLSCEHGGNRVPREYAALFTGKRKLLESHRGFDRGALAVGRDLARKFDVPIYAATTTRLLVDLNRSAHNPAVFPVVAVGRLPRKLRDALLRRHHRPHWDRIRSGVRIAKRPVLHIAVHSFTPIWRGERRNYEIGILYDPARAPERAFARTWQRELRRAYPDFRVRRNAPYRGDADGLTTALRREFPSGRYLGLELELNQRLLARPGERRVFTKAIETSLRAALSVVVSGATAPR